MPGNTTSVVRPAVGVFGGLLGKVGPVVLIVMLLVRCRRE
jgi:hypothetical protein